MKFLKSKMNVALGVLTGLLVGFVLGTAFLGFGQNVQTSGNAQGNVSRLHRDLHINTVNNDPNNLEQDGPSSTSDNTVNSRESSASYNGENPNRLFYADSVSLKAIDADGQTWTITISK